jgi:hypothetical protein
MHAAGSHGFGKLQIFKQVADNGVSYGASFMASAMAQADLPDDVSLTRNLNAMSASRMLKVKMAASSALESIEERTAQNLDIPAFLRRTSRGDLETVAKQCSRLFNVANEVFECDLKRCLMTKCMCLSPFATISVRCQNHIAMLSLMCGPK